MNTEFKNVYEDSERARAYADLEYPGTYYLAFRDIPEILNSQVVGTQALDFGCGAGRSARFLRDLGFDVIGADISEEMLQEARHRDSDGDYRLLRSDNLDALGERTFDLVLCAFTFDNIPGVPRRQHLFKELRARLNPGGRIINLVSSPDIYLNEWVSFSTREFPENRLAGSGGTVRIIMLDVPDRRPVEDVVWSHEDYVNLFASADLELIAVHRPLGRPSDGIEWLAESTIAPWTIYVLGPSAAGI